MSRPSPMILLTPLFLFLIVFVVDKVAWFPVVVQKGRAEQTPFEHLLRNIDTLKQSGPESRPWVVFLGSSRSEIFQHLHPTSIESSSLSKEAQALLTRFHLETRLPFKASSTLANFSFLERLLRPGPRPDLIVLEYSPEMLNLNGPFNAALFLQGNILDRPLLRQIFPLMDLKSKLDILIRLGFPAFHYHIRVERVLTAGPDDFDSVLTGMLFANRPPSTPLPDNYQDFAAGDIPSAIYQERFLDYSDYLKNEFILKNYIISPVELRALYESIALARKAKIPLVLWIPPIHQELARRLATTEYAGRGAAIENDLADRALLIRMPDLPCQRYVDSSHLSARCAPEVAHLLLSQAKEFYPQLTTTIRTENR
ncbi:MAG: DUF1574 family protein [Spirochaetales bacterium]|nr:DUF1574 family protein [Spirochaetales bacterium]